jgi:hypothetical protein
MSTFPVIELGDRVGEQVLGTGANDHPQNQQENNNERTVDEEGKSLAGAENDSSMFLSKRQQRLLEEGNKYEMELEKARAEAEECFRRQYVERYKREQERAEKYKMELARGFAEVKARCRSQYHPNRTATQAVSPK